MAPRKGGPPPVPAPPTKDTKKHKPTRDERQQKFVNQYTKDHPNLRGQWGNIQDIAKSAGLDAVYLAALLMTRPGGIGTDYGRIQRIADEESKRIGLTKGRDPLTQKYIPKGYALVMGGTYGGSLRSGLEKQSLKQSITNPIVFQDAYGRPVTRNDFRAEWKNLNDLFQQYLGRKATKGEAASIVKKQWTAYNLTAYLSKLPGFVKGSLWHEKSPGYVAVWESLYGQDATLRPPRDLIRKAILNGWSGDTFANEIRHLPQYERSSEYQGNFATFSGYYKAIYGEPDAHGLDLIKNAVKHRQSQAQFETALRANPAYVNSIEANKMWQRSADMWSTIFGQPTSAPPVSTQPATPKPAEQAPTLPQRVGPNLVGK